VADSSRRFPVIFVPLLTRSRELRREGQWIGAGRVLLVDGGNTAIRRFIGRSPHQSNLPDVISPLVFSFVGVFWSSLCVSSRCGCCLILLCAIQADLASVLLLFCFRVPFWGWVEGAGALESSYADSVVDCEGVGDPMLEPEPEGTWCAAPRHINFPLTWCRSVFSGFVA